MHSHVCGNTSTLYRQLERYKPKVRELLLFSEEEKKEEEGASYGLSMVPMDSIDSGGLRWSSWYFTVSMVSGVSVLLAGDLPEDVAAKQQRGRASPHGEATGEAPALRPAEYLPPAATITGAGL